MRILFVTPEYVTESNFDGGLASHLGRVCPMLAKAGHDVTVLVSSDREGTFMHDGVLVHRVRADFALRCIERVVNRATLGLVPVAMNWLLKSWQLNRVASRLHRESPFDMAQYASYTGTAFFRCRKIPAVVRISSFEPSRQLAYSLADSPDHRLMARLDLAAIKRGDAHFCPSSLIARVVAGAAGVPVQVIEPPVALDRSRWDYRPYRELLEGKRYLLFFGTLGILKGVATLSEIIEELLDRHPGLYFAFAGKDGGYRNASMIEHVLEKAGAHRNRILALGQMRHHQLHPIVSHAETVVLPSLVDNLPNSCLEAMNLGRVVVGTRGASFEELIEDGASGFLCDIDTPASLLAAVERALALTEVQRERMGERAQQRMKLMVPEVALERLLRFYRTLVEKQTRCS